MTTQNKHVPVLRFSEFAGNWEEKKLGEIGTVIRGASPRPQGDKRYYGGDVPRLMVADVTRDGKLVTPKVDFLTEEGAKLSRPCKAGTLTIVCSGTVGVPSILAVDACIHDGFLAILDIDGSHSIDYLYHRLTTLQDKFNKSATHGGVFTNLTTAVLKDFSITIPTLPEQQKIAAFLTALDEKIQRLTKKRDLLEQYKKGVMQKIFNQEIRFKDDNGNDFADWELTELKEIAARVTTKNKSNNITKVLTNSATKGIVNQQDYFDKDIANQNNLQGYYIVEKDDFVYNPRISTYAPVGPIKRNHHERGLMSPLYSVFRFKKVNLDFIEQFFETRLWHDYLKSIANYGARHDRMNITVEGFFDMPILLPLEPEQEKIANFLSSINDKINLVNQQLEKTQTFKKGLLQQMFV